MPVMRTNRLPSTGVPLMKGRLAGFTKKAKEIAKKAANGSYVEDGGYIRDWLAMDIEKALVEVYSDTLNECLQIIHRMANEAQSLKAIRDNNLEDF